MPCVDGHSLEAHRRLWKQKINEVAENTPAPRLPLECHGSDSKRSGTKGRCHGTPATYFSWGPMGRSQKNGAIFRPTFSPTFVPAAGQPLGPYWRSLQGTWHQSPGQTNSSVGHPGTQKWEQDFAQNTWKYCTQVRRFDEESKLEFSLNTLMPAVQV